MSVFVMDVSGSTVSPFQGSPVGDTNGDGVTNTILDAEIAAFTTLNQSLIDLGYANKGVRQRCGIRQSLY